MLRRYLHLLLSAHRVPSLGPGRPSPGAIARTAARLARLAHHRSPPPRLAGGAAPASEGASSPETRVVPVLGHRIHTRDLRALAYLFEEVFVEQDYRVPELGPEPRIVDGGANVGLATLYLKLRFPDARIDAFEPAPETFALLERNVAENGLEGVRLHRAALAGGAGERALFHDPARPGGLTASLVPGRAPSPGGTVPTATLSDYVGEELDLLKLDVEGAETEVISELAASGALGRIRHLVMEFHHNLPGGAGDLPGTLALLESAGFRYELVARPPASAGGPQDVLVRARRPR